MDFHPWQQLMVLVITADSCLYANGQQGLSDGTADSQLPQQTAHAV